MVDKMILEIIILVLLIILELIIFFAVTKMVYISSKKLSSRREISENKFKSLVSTGKSEIPEREKFIFQYGYERALYDVGLENKMSYRKNEDVTPYDGANGEIDNEI
ncbi:hypothetical protein EQG49_13300 [Periweissella cryptocerci]|uniref:Uncharacterized protein n=1 Tax=Periweissella cryptocerci TaxID=2506420 RepID=A0A4P6YX90_9LACO|nr:hypothetical protein [Periweissella cryptocerci]QBO37373.1 hypothetical protein EQG49_13300 [Periweissella cryptocerci]